MCYQIFGTVVITLYISFFNLCIYINGYTFLYFRFFCDLKIINEFIIIIINNMYKIYVHNFFVNLRKNIIDARNDRKIAQYSESTSTEKNLSNKRSCNFVTISIRKGVTMISVTPGAVHTGRGKEGLA